MGDTSVIKVDGSHSPKGPDGQVYLATGANIAMRLWRDEKPGEAKAPAAREYDCAGYVISGRAELHSEGQVILLNPGDSWIVPRGAKHAYKILEAFTAVEATTPPAAVHGRDAAPR
jgi:quercetin dioxygenase-like cupin family protein